MLVHPYNIVNLVFDPNLQKIVNDSLELKFMYVVYVHTNIFKFSYENKTLFLMIREHHKFLIYILLVIKFSQLNFLF